MNNSLKFTLSEMEDTYLNALKYYQAYADAISSLRTEISSLSNNWSSSETGTYEAFRQMFDEKIGTLEDARDMMKTFCETLEQKKNDFNEAAVAAINAFN